MYMQQLKKNISASVAYSSLVRYLNLKLDAERALFEGSEATEFQRGRVRAIQDLLRDLPNTGHK